MKDRQRAGFLFDPEEIRRADEPPEDGARLVWMVIALVRRREVAFDRYVAIFGRSERTFKRDLRKLRDLGERFGFGLKRQRTGAVHLDYLEDDREMRKAGTSEIAADTLLAVVDALGEVVARELHGFIEADALRNDRFLRVGTPRLVEQSAVAHAYGEVREAWRLGARVRFRYPGRGGVKAIERVVEPHAVTHVAGRYYLVGFDVHARRGGWRQFALDRIVGNVARAGSFTRRAIPAPYRGDDAIGLFKTGPAVEVTIVLSPTIAAAVVARRWQREQRTTLLADGSGTISMLVHDLGEAVRWAFGFGAEARVVAPPPAVALAASLAEQLHTTYAHVPERRAAM